jgi:hypothetical protein
MYDYRKYHDAVVPFSKALPFNDDLQHAALGLISEVGEIADALKAHMIYGKELDVLNMKEEAGDALWFARLAAHLLRVDLQDLCDGVGAVKGDAARLGRYATRAADAAAAIGLRIDAFVYEGEALPLPVLTMNLRVFIGQVARICAALGFTLADAAEANIAKLTTRYKGKAFDPVNGLVRDKEAERFAMSGAHAAVEEAPAAPAPVVQKQKAASKRA